MRRGQARIHPAGAGSHVLPHLQHRRADRLRLTHREEHTEHAGALLILPLAQHPHLAHSACHRPLKELSPSKKLEPSGIGSLILVEQHDSPSYCLAFFPYSVVTFVLLALRQLSGELADPFGP